MKGMIWEPNWLDAMNKTPYMVRVKGKDGAWIMDPAEIYGFNEVLHCAAVERGRGNEVRIYMVEIVQTGDGGNLVWVEYKDEATCAATCAGASVTAD